MSNSFDNTDMSIAYDLIAPAFAKGELPKLEFDQESTRLDQLTELLLGQVAAKNITIPNGDAVLSREEYAARIIAEVMEGTDQGIVEMIDEITSEAANICYDSIQAKYHIINNEIVPAVEALATAVMQERDSIITAESRGLLEIETPTTDEEAYKEEISSAVLKWDDLFKDATLDHMFREMSAITDYDLHEDHMIRLNVNYAFKNIDTDHPNIDVTDEAMDKLVTELSALVPDMQKDELTAAAMRVLDGRSYRAMRQIAMSVYENTTIREQFEYAVGLMRNEYLVCKAIRRCTALALTDEQADMLTRHSDHVMRMCIAHMYLAMCNRKMCKDGLLLAADTINNDTYATFIAGGGTDKDLSDYMFTTRMKGTRVPDAGYSVQYMLDGREYNRTQIADHISTLRANKEKLYKDASSVAFMRRMQEHAIAYNEIFPKYDTADLKVRAHSVANSLVNIMHDKDTSLESMSYDFFSRLFYHDTDIPFILDSFNSAMVASMESMSEFDSRDKLRIELGIAVDLTLKQVYRQR